MSLLEVEDLSVAYPTRRGTVTAVEDADLTVEPGQIHGLVGESGAGKSTVGAAIMGLIDAPGGISGGRIRFRGEAISGLDRAAMRALRGKKISMIFQDPLTALNPLLTVGEQIVETMQLHLKVDEASFNELVGLLRETLEDFDFEPEDVDQIIQDIEARKPYIVTS